MTHVESLQIVNPDVIKPVEAVRTIELQAYLESLDSSKVSFQGKGYESLVLSAGDFVLKVKLRGGMSEAEASLVARLAYPNSKALQDRVVVKLTDSFDDTHVYERQAIAHHRGHTAAPWLVDANVTLLKTNSRVNPGRICGLVMPRYDGFFVSLSDSRFNLSKEERNLLVEQGILVDDFSRRKNGVILKDGSRRIFDITVR